MFGGKSYPSRACPERSRGNRKGADNPNSGSHGMFFMPWVGACPEEGPQKQLLRLYSMPKGCVFVPAQSPRHNGRALATRYQMKGLARKPWRVS